MKFFIFREVRHSLPVEPGTVPEVLLEPSSLEALTLLDVHVP